MISIKNVFFGYTGEQETLRDVSLTVNKGECVLLCGESGCGKTTVTKLINGLIPHFTEGGNLRGEVTAAGLVVAKTELYKLANHIGSVFQNPKSQFFNLDTDSELAFGLENCGTPPNEIEERLVDTVSVMQISSLLNRNIFTLSGGEKQQLAFSGVYAMNPEIYVLDEPTANLDEAAIERVRDIICQLKKAGSTVVIAEHRLYFLMGLIDRAVYFKDGKVVRCFTGEEFRRLAEAERISMGLRSLVPSTPKLPSVRRGNFDKGLVVNDLTVGYKKEPPVLNRLSFSVLPGDVIAVTGHNGAGKTTLVRCLCGLIKERSGQISLDGRELNLKKRRQASFCVMQDVNHQLFYDSVWNECEQVGGQSNAEIEQALDSFDLLPFKDQHPMALSGGQKQRLAVAITVMSGKNILIFDEPTSGLDWRHMQEICTVVRRLSEQGHLVLVVTHDKEFMQIACDRVLELK